MKQQILFSSKTDVGQVRKQNEDNLGFSETPNGKLFIVCDGMGGHVGGQIASSLAVESLMEFFSQEIHENPIVAIHNAIMEANTKVFSASVDDPSLKGMGTTCVVLLAKEDGIYFGHVGDSRIYLQSEAKLFKVTRDHSFVQGLVDQGIIPEEEAENHPRKNEILQALGTRDTVKPDVCKTPILPASGDKILMCSDGLNGMITDKTIEEILNSELDVHQKAEQLILLANQAGGTDNITVQLIEVTEGWAEKSVFTPILPPQRTQEIPAEEIHREEKTEVKAAAPTSENNKGNKGIKRLLILIAIAVVVLGAVFYFLILPMLSPKEPKNKIDSTKLKPPFNLPNTPNMNINRDTTVEIQSGWGWNDLWEKFMVCPEKIKEKNNIDGSLKTGMKVKIDLSFSGKKEYNPNAWKYYSSEAVGYKNGKCTKWDRLRPKPELPEIPADSPAIGNDTTPVSTPASGDSLTGEPAAPVPPDTAENSAAGASAAGTPIP